MITNAKRRFYLFILAAMGCFLCATVLYDMVEFGIGSRLMDSASGVLEFVGCIMGFLAFEALSYPDDYDRYDKLHQGQRYARYFFALALAMGLATVVLIAGMLLHGVGVKVGDQLVAFWGLIVVAACIMLGRKSRKEIV
jgi:hypothetical protein